MWSISKVVLGTLLVAGGDAAELLQEVEEPLDSIARLIDLSIEASMIALFALGLTKADQPYQRQCDQGR